MLTTSGSPDFHHELQAICSDPKVRSLARRRARNPDLAEDALQEAYYLVARKDPADIRDLRAYLCQVLIREVNHLRGHSKATLVDDFESLADARQGRPSVHPPVSRPVADTVCTHLLTQAWLQTFATRREELTASVPGRSPGSDRYRDVIVTAAEHVLLGIIAGASSNADCNAALSTAYPEWFGEPGCAENTRDQRFRRARVDVRALLRIIINRDDLDP